MPADRATWAHLRDVFRPYRSWLLLAFACVVVGAGSALAVPWLAGELVDAAATPEPSSRSLDALAALLLGLLAVQAVTGGVRSWALARAGQNSVRDLRVGLFRRVVSLPVSYFDRTHSGAITSRLQSDAGAVYGSGAGAAPQTAFALLTVVGGTVLLFWISPVLGFLILLVVPVAAILAVVSGRRTRSLSREYQDQMALTSAYAADTVSGIRVIKAFSAEPQVVERFDDLTLRSVDLGMQRARVRSVWGAVTAVLASTGIVAAVWLGGHQIQDGTLSTGELLAFIWYGLVVTRGISDLSSQYGRLQQMLGSADRVTDLLTETAEAPQASRNIRAADTTGPALLPHRSALRSAHQSALQLRDVRLTYPGRAQPALRDVSLSIGAGESVALVGPSGSGKSSVARALLRLYEVDSGEILIRGVDARHIPLTELRRMIALVPQEAHLLAGTVADNLRLGWPDAPLERLHEAARQAHASEFIAGLPQGFDTVVGERGATLSGGQQQRLAIARALVRDPAVLILDEATSALDAASEATVRDAIASAMRGRTSLVIAHRLSTVRTCDRVVVMSAGRVVEQGSPAELMGGEGLFAELADLQR